MRYRIVFLVLAGIIGFAGIPVSDAFFDGIAIVVPGQTMDISQNVISPEETMFVNGSFKQPVGDFSTSIFKNYEDSRKLVLTLNPTTNESGDFNFNFTIPKTWELGNYYMIVENGLQSMDWEFTVRQNYSGGTLDRTVYPVPWMIDSPLKQFRSGIPTDEIQCKHDLVLIQRHDGSPVCVKPKSINPLIFRGWADDKFRTPPIIDFQNPDRIFREVGYLGLMMLLPYVEENQTVAISLEGKPNMVLPIIQRYDVEILSEKTNSDESFSSIYGKTTKTNLQKFFEENSMNRFVNRGVLLTSLGGYQDNTGTYGPFNQFLSDNDSQIIGDALGYYESKRTNGEDVHFDDFVKWPTGKINESFIQKPKPLDIASIEENRITLNPTDTCAHISLRLLSADKLEQYHSLDKEVRFFEVTEADLKELPVLDELIRATHHLEFSTNDDAHAEMGLRELVDYEFFIMEKAIDKYSDSQDDYFVKLDGNLDEKLADPKPQGFSNEFLPPQLVYDGNVYVLGHTFFWVANEHETQHMSVHLQDRLDDDEKFITLTEKDMESIPKIKQAIEKIGTEFESIGASKGLPENPDWNEYREWFGQKKTEHFNPDETYVPGFVYDGEYYDLGFPIC